MPTRVSLGPPIKLAGGGTRMIDPATGQFYFYPADRFFDGPASTEKYETYKTSVLRVKPQGLDLLSSMTGYSASSEILVLSVVRDNVGNVVVADQPYASLVYLPDTAFNIADNQARLKVLSKIKGATWNLSTFLGELPETWSFVSSVAKRLVSSYRAVKRGDMRSLHRIVQPPKNNGTTVKYYGKGRSSRRINFAKRNSSSYQSEYWSGKWMEWRYAVLPMLYDFDDALKALNDSHTRPFISTVKASANASENFDLSNSQYDYYGFQNVRSKYVVHFKVNSSLDGFKKLGLLNPVETMWELTPLSFVLDWFIPVGDYLASLDAMAGVTVIGSTSSSKSTKFAYRLEKFTNDSWNIRTAFPATTNVKEYDRNGRAYLTAEIPQFSLGLNARRVIDGLSLLRLGLNGIK